MAIPRQLVKPIIALVASILIGYFIVLPLFWGPPSVEAKIPGSAPLSQDLTFDVVLSANHKNFHVTNVRFYVDYYESTAKGPEGLFNPAIVYEQTAAPKRGFFRTSLFTWPHSRKLHVTVPFEQFAAEGLLGPGRLSGKVDVNCTYSQITPYDRVGGGSDWRQHTVSAPFRIQITE